MERTIVTPCTCSAFSLCKTQTYLEEPTLISEASFLKFFSGPFVNPTTCVGQMAGSGGLAYKSNDVNVNMNLFFPHFGLHLAIVFIGTYVVAVNPF